MCKSQLKTATSRTIARPLREGKKGGKKGNKNSNSFEPRKNEGGFYSKLVFLLPSKDLNVLNSSNKLWSQSQIKVIMSIIRVPFPP